MEEYPLQKPPLLEETPLEEKYKTAEKIANAALQRIIGDPTHKPVTAISHIFLHNVKIEGKNIEEKNKKRNELYEQSLALLKKKMKDSIVTPEMRRGAAGREKSIPYDSR